MPETPPPMTATPTASHEDDDQVDQDAQEGQQQPAMITDAQTSQGQGNVPDPLPPANRPVETYRPVVQAVRGPRGRFESLVPKQPPAPAKAQSVALLKPLPVTTYDDSITPKGGIQGLSTIPKNWPDLPGNVSLSSEVAWVQAERLRVVLERPSGGVRVDLSKARTPAPSMAALSWLETSIRSYAKFVEVAAKQAGVGQDEAEFIRKERMAINEIRALLAEMHQDSPSS